MKQKLYALFILTCLNGWGANLLAQNGLGGGQEFFRSITFGQNIDFGKVDDDVRCNITTPTGKNVTLNGNTINYYTFDTPGVYQILTSGHQTHSETCDHSHLPEKILIQVAALDFQFDFNKISFSRPLSVGTVDGVQVKVPVTIKSRDYDGDPIRFGGIAVAGVGAMAEGVSDQEEIKFKEGIVMLSYTLKGSLQKPGYVMLDFIDSNQTTHTYYLPEPIK